MRRTFGNHGDAQLFAGAPAVATGQSDGEYLSGSAEYMRRWVYDRWGLRQGGFSVKCKVFVAGSREEFRLLFRGKDAPQVRVDRDASGKVTALSIWCWSEPRWNTSVLPHLMTEVCLAEFEQGQAAACYCR